MWGVGVGTGLRELHDFLRIDAVMSVRGFRGFWSVVAREDCFRHSLRFDRKAGCWSTWAWDSRSNSSSVVRRVREVAAERRVVSAGISLFFLGPFLGAFGSNWAATAGLDFSGEELAICPEATIKTFPPPFSRFEHQCLTAATIPRPGSDSLKGLFIIASVPIHLGRISVQSREEVNGHWQDKSQLRVVPFGRSLCSFFVACVLLGFTERIMSPLSELLKTIAGRAEVDVTLQ